MELEDPGCQTEKSLVRSPELRSGRIAPQRGQVLTPGFRSQREELVTTFRLSTPQNRESEPRTNFRAVPPSR